MRAASEPGGDEDLVLGEDDVLRPQDRPSRIGEALDALVRRRRWSSRLEGARIFHVWEEVVGPELADRCEPVKLVGGRLVVRAESGPWATQVRYLTARIIERSGEVLRPGLVRSIQVVVGPLQGRH